MSNIDAHVARCSNDDDAMRRTSDLNARRLACSRAFLGGTRKPAWHKGFCSFVADAKEPETRVSRTNFSPRTRRARRHLDDSQQAKFFFTDSRRKRTEERNRDRTRANRHEVIRLAVPRAAQGERPARRFCDAEAWRSPRAGEA